MLKSRFAKLGAAGFAAAAGVILITSSAGAHHSTAHATLLPLTGLVSTTAQVGTEIDQDATADAAALAAKAQAEAAELAAEQQKAAAEAAAEAADTETGDTETETGDTETGDTETGVQSGDDSSETAGTGTKTAPKSGD
jgi:hypothetical protein